MFKQNGQAVARVRAPVASASCARRRETRCMGFSYLVGFICDYWLENPGPPQVDVLRAAAAVIANSYGRSSRAGGRGRKPDVNRAA